MRKALESLPWVRKATIDFANKQATATVVSKSYDEKMLLKALKDAGFGGSVETSSEKTARDEEPVAKTQEGARVAFRVSGMKKTKSGAT